MSRIRGTPLRRSTRHRLASTARGLPYPKDFAKAPEVTSAPGDWTVVAYLAENEDRSSWKVFGCTGFHAPRRQG
ncbi:hypothetical protein ACE1OA_16175 [Streptomyces sp. JL2001]|uniref:hypothetical protein n=1 Tax=Streptomyces sp. JL2001 TaxID=3342488 RepID=UPI003D804B37